MSDLAIKIENLSKQYRLGQIGTGTLSHDLNRWFAKIRGKEDPTLKIGQTNRLDTVDGDLVWALKDINLEVKKGEILGIIGKNGAGKSTLLKILSRVTGPTTGSIKVNGRIASLLEVGTGFHPELTGRENIFLNGAILGMTKREIKSKFDEIIDFAGVAKYVDTPVKRYSSGMYVRLAFAVAAHLEPEILVVDEVLAVGDAEFQKKAIGKMQDVSREGGRTVLFVSHNMGSIKALCNKGVVLQNGKLIFEGGIDETLTKYLNTNSTDQNISTIFYKQDESKATQIIKVELKDKDKNVVIEYFAEQEIFVNITLRNDYYQENARLNFSIQDKYDNLIFINRRQLDFIGIKTWTIKIPGNLLIANLYKIGLALDIPKIKILDLPSDKINLNIINLTQEEFKEGDRENGYFKIPVEWEI